MAARLTEKQKRFVSEYLVDLNATQAAIRAGYKKKSAYSIGQENLKKPEIQSALQEAMQKRETRTEVTQDMVVRELARVAFNNGAVYARVVTNAKGFQAVELTDTDKLTDDQRAAIAGIKETKYGIEVSSYDKVKALELLGKHLGMFADKADKDDDGGEVQIIDDL